MLNISFTVSLQVIKENDRDREEERLRPHDPISEHLLWLMMHHIRRRQVLIDLLLFSMLKTFIGLLFTGLKGIIFFFSGIRGVWGAQTLHLSEHFRV